MRFGAQFVFVFAAAQMVDYQKTVAEHCAAVSLCKVCTTRRLVWVFSAETSVIYTIFHSFHLHLVYISF